MIRQIATMVMLSASMAQADLVMTFQEGAPKDRFTLIHDGTCALDRARVTLDLSTAPAGLIFDVTASGAGVEVFQPFELVAGTAQLDTLPRVLDGDQAIAMQLTNFGPGQSVAFTIDVDDTGGGRETTVSGSEIANATLRATIAGRNFAAPFGADAKALIPFDGCIS